MFLPLGMAHSSQISQFAEDISKIRECVSFSVTSWHRSEHRNRLVGGHPNSLHLDGMAIDVVLDHPSDIKYFIRRLDDLNLDYRDEGDHIHIQMKRKHN